MQSNVARQLPALLSWHADAHLQAAACKHLMQYAVTPLVITILHVGVGPRVWLPIHVAHARRKENQIYSAEERAALAMYNFEEKKKKVGAI